ncbi:MAG: hypothetical protein CVU39_26175 [Chloroflexi bacterium HGW-Chloroflexi-10]|nr:MAG: hypothetical protein CVU39_26175 [Chloroflexi bacterium HGW-Chloroflexi-10]
MDKGLESLKVWQKAMDFVTYSYKNILPVFPDEEKYALTSQLRRALVSIPANIAEGYGRQYFREGIRFGLIARGSLEEVRTYFYLAVRLGYLTEELCAAAISQSVELRRILNGYLKYLEKQLDSKKEVMCLHEDPELYQIEQDFTLTY